MFPSSRWTLRCHHPGPQDAAGGPGPRLFAGHRTGELPGLLYIHGGGFRVMGDLDMTDATAARFADLVNAVVVSVDYRAGAGGPFRPGLRTATRR